MTTLYDDITRALAERDARIEGLTIERDFHRETADLHAARIAELEGKLARAVYLLRGLGHGYYVLCGEARKRYHESTGSYYAHSQAFLEEIDNAG